MEKRLIRWLVHQYSFLVVVLCPQAAQAPFRHSSRLQMMPMPTERQMKKGFAIVFLLAISLFAAKDKRVWVSGVLVGLLIAWTFDDIMDQLVKVLNHVRRDRDLGC